MFPLPSALPSLDETKGSDLMERLLLLQYQNSPILKEYLQAFIDEMDLLFKETEAVYLGRFIEFAVGQQLDIIGIILGQTRGVDLPVGFFGFSDENGGTPLNPAFAVKLADETTPSDGGIFRSEGQGATGNIALSDPAYRKLLLAKAFMSTRDEISTNNAYYAISILIGRTPRSLRLLSHATSVDGVSSGIADGRLVVLEISEVDTSVADRALIVYFSKYLIPLGTSFSITLV